MHLDSKISKIIGLVFCAALFAPAIAQAEFQFLPDSRNHQYRTYGLFFEQQTTLVFRNGGRAWGALGNSIALTEMTDVKWKPQLILHGSANVSFRLNGSGDTLLTETDDARVGLMLTMEMSSSWRNTLIWTHQSGHISDNVDDKQLIGSNLGNEILSLRSIYDIDQSFRLGGSLKPVLGSDPGMVRFGAEQFAEWFPHGASSNPRELVPFIAMGLEQTGRYKIGLTYHAQLGFTAGSHFGTQKHSTIRLVAGYYTGADTRLKYFQFMNSRVQFGYLGAMFDL